MQIMSSIEGRREARVLFLGEQEGSAERTLKDRLRRRFNLSDGVEKAYLARVRYSECGTVHVALALVAQVERMQDIVNSIGALFRSEFNPSQSLDIVFLSPE